MERKIKEIKNGIKELLEDVKYELGRESNMLLNPKSIDIYINRL